jgi:DNA processing protein
MIQENGGILTEFMSGTPPDRHNFPNRNRIVAGLCDAIVVVESGEKGGSMVTASLANGYNREVMAYPGRTTDKRSAGCNQLLQQQRAQLITCAQDLLRFMNWENKEEKKRIIQPSLFQQLAPAEQLVVNYLTEKELAEMDEIQAGSGLSGSLLASSLLNLELNGLVRKLPGQRFMLV